MLAKIKKILTCAFVASSISAFGEQGQIAQANGIDIWYETFGNQNDPPLKDLKIKNQMITFSKQQNLQASHF